MASLEWVECKAMLMFITRSPRYLSSQIMMIKFGSKT